MASQYGLTPELPASISIPSTGKYRLFLNSSDADRLYMKDDAGNIVIVGEGAAADFPIATAAGTADAITATYTPALTLIDKQLCAFVATAANATTTPTFAPDGLTAHTIVKNGGSALVAGDIPAALAVCILEYNLANTRWELLNPAKATVTGAALTKADDTNVTLTLGGTPATSLLQAVLLTLGWTGQLALSRGGTNKNMTAVNGGIVWTDADSMEVTAAGTSGQLVQSNGAAAPSFVTAIANGITATTQTPGDNSTKLATTAYAETASGGWEKLFRTGTTRKRYDIGVPNGFHPSGFSLAIPANRLTCAWRYYSKNRTIDEEAIYVITPGSAAARATVYIYDTVNGYPINKIHTFTEHNCSAAGKKENTGLALSMPAGGYWFVIHVNEAITIPGIPWAHSFHPLGVTEVDNTDTSLQLFSSAYAYGAAPATFAETDFSFGTTTFPVIGTIFT